MSRKKRRVNCVILTRLHRPSVIWRFFRRHYFHWITRKIGKLPKLIGLHVIARQRSWHGRSNPCS